MAGFRLQLMRSPLAVLAMVVNATFFCGQAKAVDTIVSGGIDSTSSVVANVNSDGSGGIFAVIVGSNYTGYSGDPSLSGADFITGVRPGVGGQPQAQLSISGNSVALNSATSVNNTLGVQGATTLSSTLGVQGDATLSSTLGVQGAATLSSTLGVQGAATLSSTLAVTGAASLSSTLGVNGVSTLGRSTISGLAGGTTILKGGTSSGVLTLQDGNTVGGGNPAGTSITISGSGGGAAATVFQTTTDANTTSVSTAIGTSAVYANGSTALLQAGPNNAVTVNSGNTGATPGVSINGVVGAGSASTTGVLITGSGQNALPYTPIDRANGVVPTWADVSIQSKSYGLGDPTLGSALLLTDYGIQILSPQPVAGQSITNNTGNNSSSGSITNNNGLNTGSGSVANSIGNNSGSGSAINTFGMNSSTTGGTVANSIGGISGNGNVTNLIGQNNGAGVAINSFGTGTGVTNNFIGNNNPSSFVQLDGGPSRMTLNGNGATFSDASTGGPIPVHGVADGSSSFDAVNVRQLFGAVAASMATTPSFTTLKAGEAGLGLGFGNYGGYSALGVNYTYSPTNSAQLNVGVARGIQGGSETAIRASIGFKL
jgi:hypothetical protein